MRVLVILAVLSSLSLSSSVTSADCPPPRERPKLVVGTVPIAPFIIKKDDGWGGISIDLWKAVAERVGWVRCASSVSRTVDDGIVAVASITPCVAGAYRRRIVGWVRYASSVSRTRSTTASSRSPASHPA